MGQLARDSFSSSTRGSGFKGDIGTPTPTGSDSLNSGVWSVTSGGADISGIADQFHFVAQPIANDASLSCQIVSQSNTNGFAKTGIMFRNDTTSGSVYYACLVTPSNGIRIQARNASGITSINVATISSLASPVYLKVTRNSNTFNSYWSTDGVAWNFITTSQYTIPTVTGVMMVGLAVCSHNTGATSSVIANSFTPTLNPNISMYSGWGNSTDDGQGWIQQTGANPLTISNNEGVISGTGQTDLQIGTKTTKDQEVRCRISIGNSADQVGIQARFSVSGGVVTSYRLRINSGSAFLDKKLSGSTTSFLSSSITLTVGTFYWFVLRCTGSSIQAKYWQDGANEPGTWLLSTTDTSITSGGFSVECNPSSFSTGVQFDHFYAQDGFITRNNTHLIYNGTTMFIGGCNAYWMANNTAQNIIDDGLATAVELGCNVIRIKNIANSQGPVGQQYEAAQNVFTESSLATNDYTIWKAGLLGLKIIAPFCDYYDNGYGWYGTFAGWNNVANSSFWTNSSCISDYENYINHIINHVNIYTGIPWKDDSTILAWESMNEPSLTAVGASTLATWTQAISAYTKSVDTNHLFQDGTTIGVNTSNLSDVNTDMYTNHYYPLSTTQLTTDITAMSGSNKVFYIGEYDWTQRYGGSTLSAWFTLIEGNTAIAGDCFWEIYGHGSISGWVTHNDGYSMYYPRYNTNKTPNSGQIIDVTSTITAIRNHLYKMSSGISAPTPIIPSAPTLFCTTPINGGVTEIQWGGVMGAYSYSLEASTSGGTSGFSVITSVLTDFSVAQFWVGYLLNNTSDGTVWYRIRAANVNGTYGPYSLVDSALSSIPAALLPTATRRDGDTPSVIRRDGNIPLIKRRG